MKTVHIFLNGKYQRPKFQAYFDPIQNCFFVESNETQFKETQKTSKKTQKPENEQSPPQLYFGDGGLDSYLKHNASIRGGIKNHNKATQFWFGDNDSLSLQGQKYLKENPQIVVKKLAEYKDFSDFGAILDAILKTIVQREEASEPWCLEIFGGLGGSRPAHEHANVEEVKRFISLLPRNCFCIFYNGLIISSAGFRLLHFKNQLFSIFTSNFAANSVENQNHYVEIQGALYEGNVTLTRPSHGLSNQSTQDILCVKPNGCVVEFYFS